jgi:hypothetical protein
MAEGIQLVVDGEVAARPTRAVLSFWLGVVGLVVWLVPILGLPVSGVGLVLAAKGRRAGAERAGLAMVLCAIGATLSLVMWIASAVFVGMLNR